MNWLKGKKLLKEISQPNIKMYDPQKSPVSQNAIGTMWFDLAQSLSNSLSMQTNGYSFKCLTIAQIIECCTRTPF